MTVLTNKEGMAKSATAKSRLKVTYSLPVPSGPSPRLTKSASSCSRSKRPPISASCKSNGDKHSGRHSSMCVSQSFSQCLNKQRMNTNSVIDTPEPYLEPIRSIKFINDKKATTSSYKRRHAVPVGLLSPQPRSSTTREFFAEQHSTSAVDRPIPPPKVVIDRQRLEREVIPEETLIDSRQSCCKKSKQSQLAYLIVDLDSVGTADFEDSCHKDKRSLDDTSVECQRSSKLVEGRALTRSYTMSSPAERPKTRPKPPPRYNSSTSKDSLKGTSGLEEGRDKHITTTTTTESSKTSSERESTDGGSSPLLSSSPSTGVQKPTLPPRPTHPPPKRPVKKLASMPPFSNSSSSSSVGDDRKSSLPSLYNKVEQSRTRTLTQSTDLLDSSDGSSVSDISTLSVDMPKHSSELAPRIPLKKRKLHVNRTLPTPPPPNSLSPLTTSSLSKSCDSSSNDSIRMRQRKLSDSRPKSSIVPGRSQARKTPPSRPAPPDPKLVQKVAELKAKMNIQDKPKKRQSSSGTGVRPYISEPLLISTTMSRTMSATDVKKLNQSRNSVSTSSSPALSSIPKDNDGQPLYEDVDLVLSLPPSQEEMIPKSLTPQPARRPFDDVPPELPPKGSSTDPTSRRRARSISSSVHSFYQPLKRSECESEESEDHPELFYEPIRTGSTETPSEPDVGGVDDYVAMRPVVISAWETKGAVNSVESEGKGSSAKEFVDHPDEAYVEMHPASHCTLSQTSPDLDKDEPEPIYVEMDPDEYMPPPPELHYASKDLLSKRPDLKLKSKANTS